MNKKLTILVTLFSSVFISSLLYGVTLQWDIPVNMRLEVVKTARVKFLYNARTVKIYDERSIINLSCYQKNDNVSRVRGEFNVFKKEVGEKVFQHKKERKLKTHKADFGIETTGRYIVKKKDLMPNFRHIPSFPQKDLKKGETWTSNGELIFDNFTIPFKLTFPAVYTVKDIRKDGESTIALIDYSFKFDRIMTGMKIPADFPKRITGKNNGSFYWDVGRKRPMDMRDLYQIKFVFQNGNGGISGFVVQEFQMDIRTKNRMYMAVSKEQQEKARHELEKVIPKESGIKVDSEKRGLVLRLGDMLFDFDSYSLKNKTRKKLEGALSMIRKKYPDRELLVEGHTDNTGDPLYNKRLSKNRAITVAGYLKNKIRHDKVSYRGYGETKPLTSNDSKEGRKLNRRVEIIIKLN